MNHAVTPVQDAGLARRTVDGMLRRARAGIAAFSSAMLLAVVVLVPATSAVAEESLRSISGVVSLPAGAPSEWLRAVQVSAMPLSGSEYKSVPVDPATGMYSVTELAPGSYRIQFWVTSYWDGAASVRPNLVSELYDDTTDHAAAFPVDVTEASATGIDAQLATGRTISGNVSLPAGSDPAWLSAISVNASANGSNGNTRVDPTTGDYTITGLAPAQYQVQFTVGPYWDGTTLVTPNLVSEYYDDATSWNTATPVDLTSTDQTGIDAALDTGRTITGTITLPDDAPAQWLSAVTVSASPTNGSMLGGVGAIPDPVTGSYTLTGLKPGAYIVKYSVMTGMPGTDVPNLVDEYYNNAFVPSDAEPVEVSTENRTNIDVTLETGHSISGTVTLPADAPADWNKAVRVSVLTPDGQQLRYDSVLADSETGEYTYPRLPSGDYVVRFDASSFFKGSELTYTDLATEYYDDATGIETARVLSTRSGDHTRIDAELGHGASVAGTIDLTALRRTADPDAGFGIVVTDVNGSVVTSYGDGFYADEVPLTLRNLAPGRYRVAVQTTGWNAVEETSEFQSIQFLRFGNSAEIDVKAGDRITGQTLTARAADSAISGSIRAEGFESSGETLGSALVYELVDGTWLRLPTSDSFHAAARFDTTANGDMPFKINLAAGTYTVGFEADFATTGIETTEEWWNKKTTLAEATPLIVRPGETVNGISGWLRPAGWPTPDPTEQSPFVDIPLDYQFYDEISWLSEQGISTGWTTGASTREFRPWNPVTRDAMAAFLYRAAGSPSFEAPRVSPFADIPKDYQFYKEITWLYDEGISTGWVVDGRREYRPWEPITRDAMAAFLYRYAGSPKFSAPEVSPFRDISADYQFYKEISWMYDEGISMGWVVLGHREYRPWDSVTRDAMAAFLYRAAE